VRQAPPLTPEYQAVWEGNIAAEATGSQEYNPQSRCLPGGMPRMMIAYEPMELVITPEITYVIMEYLNPLRRILYRRPRLPEECGLYIRRLLDRHLGGYRR
jgi:hypothetical protein